MLRSKGGYFNWDQENMISDPVLSLGLAYIRCWKLRCFYGIHSLLIMFFLVQICVLKMTIS